MNYVAKILRCPTPNVCLARNAVTRNGSLNPPPARNTSVDRYGADPRDPPTREALARNEGRSLEGVAQDDVARDAEAIEQLMEIVLQKEKDDTEKAKKQKKKEEAEQAKNKKVGPARPLVGYDTRVCASHRRLLVLADRRKPTRRWKERERDPLCSRSARPLYSLVEAESGVFRCLLFACSLVQF